MKKILVCGAGKSSTSLINYLLQKNMEVHVADLHTSHLSKLFANSHNLKTHSGNIVENTELRDELIKNADIVISLMPPTLHVVIAQACLHLNKSLITASYVSQEMLAFNEMATNKKILFMCEMGLDPGIDHMSAMKIIDEVKNKNGIIKSFKSHCGGLVAPECDNNPWHYKISWNPRNVVLAGKAGAQFLLNNKTENISHDKIFENCETISLPPLGTLAYYPNRDSMHYLKLYGLNNVHTLQRTTLRYPVFTKAWDVIINLGLTIEDLKINTDGLSYADFMAQLLKCQSQEVENKIINYCKNDTEVLQAINYLNLASTDFINKGEQSPADVLQGILEQKWKLAESDTDMIAMQHEFEYELENKLHKIKSSLVVKGINNVYTAMAKTVGLPMGILACKLLNGEIKNIYGVQIPIMPEVYEPVLQELKENGIEFDEVVV